MFKKKYQQSIINYQLLTISYILFFYIMTKLILNHERTKTEKREIIRQKIKSKPRGGTLSGQKKKMETNRFYESRKKILNK